MPYTGPSVIDTTSFGKPDNDNTPCGPFEYGGARYIFFQSAITAIYHAYKSTDGGGTWAELDAVNAPIAYRGFGFYPSSGGATYYVACKHSDNTVVLYTFSMATETWSAALTTGGPTISTIVGYERTSTGVDRVLCVTGAIFSQQIWVYSYSSGWDAGVRIDDNISNPHTSPNATMAIDPDDKLHIQYYGTQTSWPYAVIGYYLRQMELDKTLNTAQDLDVNWIGGRMSFLGTQLIIPCYEEESTIRTTSYPAVIIADPYTDSAPTLTKYTLATNVRIGNIQSYSNGTTAWITWILDYVKSGVLWINKDQLIYVTYDGSSFSGETVYHDEIANPTHPDEEAQFLHDLMPPVVLSNGALAVVCSLEYTVESTTYCAAHYFQYGGTTTLYAYAFFGHGTGAVATGPSYSCFS